MQYCSPLPWFSGTELSLPRRSGFMPSTSCTVLAGGGDTRANFSAITTINEPQTIQGMENSYRTVTRTLIAVWRNIHSKALLTINSTIRCILDVSYPPRRIACFKNPLHTTLSYTRESVRGFKRVFATRLAALPQIRLLPHKSRS